MIATRRARASLARLLRRLAAAGGVVGACAGAAQAGTLQYCERPAALSSAEQDRVFRFAAVVRQVLQQAGTPAALIARSGQDLARFGQRYSHAGISLAESANGPWSVRQLYYACDEAKPRLFDQGVAGFVAGMDRPDQAYVLLLLLPPEPAQALARQALSTPQALRLLGADYSANAYAFSTRYQNCNQWVAELLAAAWGDGGLPPGPGEPALEPPGEQARAQPGEPARQQAQAWLAAQGYTPTLMDASAPWLALLQPFIPFVHADDHPPADAARRRYRVSMPSALEGFVQARVAQAQRVEICHSAARVVVHRGWSPVAEGCLPAEGDEVIALD